MRVHKSLHPSFADAMTSREQRLPRPLPAVFALDLRVNGPDVGQQVLVAEPVKMAAGPAHQLNDNDDSTSCRGTAKLLPLVVQMVTRRERPKREH